jgi:anti-sigma B factor antagonist
MRTNGLLMTEEDADGSCLVAVYGELDLRTAPDLCATLDRHRGDRVMLDLTRLDFCDSSGLRVLLGEAREMRIVGGALTVVAPSGTPVRRLLELTGLLETIAVREDRAAA